MILLFYKEAFCDTAWWLHTLSQLITASRHNKRRQIDGKNRQSFAKPGSYFRGLSQDDYRLSKPMVSPIAQRLPGEGEQTWQRGARHHDQDGLATVVLLSDRSPKMIWRGGDLSQRRLSIFSSMELLGSWWCIDTFSFFGLLDGTS